MKMPEGYNEAQVSGEFVPVTPGGHYCEIKKVEERQSSTGKPMVVVYFEFTGRDMQSGYFTKMYQDDTREDKKWPFAGTKYVMVNDYKDPNKTSRQFKTFCSCVENSNQNFTVQWGDDWGAQFVGKQIGVIFGREESEYNGKVSMRCVPKYFCRVDAVETARVPEDKYLAPASGGIQPPEGMVLTADELPF